MRLGHRPELHPVSCCGNPGVRENLLWADACGNECGYQGDPCGGSGNVEWEFVIHPADNSKQYWQSAVGPDGSLYLWRGEMVPVAKSI